MTWLGESMLNVTEAEADRSVPMTRTLDVTIESKGVSGTVSWLGDEAFNGDPISKPRSFSGHLGHDGELHG